MIGILILWMVFLTIIVISLSSAMRAIRTTVQYLENEVRKATHQLKRMGIPHYIVTIKKKGARKAFNVEVPGSTDAEVFKALVNQGYTSDDIVSMVPDTPDGSPPRPAP